MGVTGLIQAKRSADADIQLASLHPSEKFV